MRVFVCFFAFFGAKIWPAAADTGELARDLRDQTLLPNPASLAGDDASAARYTPQRTRAFE